MPIKRLSPPTGFTSSTYSPENSSFLLPPPTGNSFARLLKTKTRLRFDMWTQSHSVILTAFLSFTLLISTLLVLLALNKAPFRKHTQEEAVAISKKFEPPTEEEPVRKLPYAVIIGVKKAGTRALLEYLRLHPDVRAPGPETHFFDRYYSRGFEWYRRQMPQTSPGQLCIEKTPAYFVRKEVPDRIHAMSPNTKLIVVVRDPVTRAISDYTQSYSKGRTRKEFEAMAFRDGSMTTVDQHWSAIRIGIYIRHLKKWLHYFSSNQIHFVSGEKLIADPVEETKLVEKFLGLKPYISQELFSFNHTKGFPCVKKQAKDTQFRCLGKTKGREHPKLNRNTLKVLRNFYEPFNEEFFQYNTQVEILVGTIENRGS